MGGSSTDPGKARKPSSGSAGGCDLDFETTVHGPDPDQVKRLSLREPLNVLLGGPNGRTILVKTLAGATVGSLVGLANAGQLIKCINDGVKYNATVILISSGTVQVRVQNLGS